MKRHTPFISSLLLLIFLGSLVVGCSSPTDVPAPELPTQTVEQSPSVEIQIQTVEVTVEVETVVTPTPEPTQQPQGGGVLLFGKPQEAVGLDPHLVTAISSRMLVAQVYNQLVALDENLLPVPELSEDWEIEDDTIYTFHLRSGVKFHNGREMVASDVKYSFERILDPDVASPWASRVNMIDTIDVVDDYTVVFNLTEPYGAFLAALAFDWAAIIPEEIVEENGDLQQEMVGTGPFMLEEYIPDTKTVMVANPDYWGQRPMVDGITFLIMPDEASRLAALRTGDIHLTQLSDPAAVSMAVRSEGLSVFTQPTVDYYMLGINTQRAPLDDVRVRQALSLAINREVALNTVLFGEGYVSGPIPPTLGDWAIPISELPNFQQDIEKAKELLVEAGYPDGFTFTIVASPFFPEFVSIALVLQDQLKEIGVTVEIDQAEWGNFITMWRERNFDSFVSYQTAGADPDYALYGYFYGGSSFNATQLDDSDVNRLLDEGRRTVDYDQRLDIYRDAQIELANAVPDIFLFTRTEYIAIRDSVNGFYLRSVDPYTYPAMQTLWIEE